MKVVFATPMLDGNMRAECHHSLVATYILLIKQAIDFDELTISDCPYLPVARNTLVAMFMDDPKATDLFFIDSDVGFDASAVLRILSRPEKIVAGIYPLKKDEMEYPVRLKTEDGVPVGRDGLIEGELLPTGFMRIKRVVFERMAEAYPQLKYEENVVRVRGSGVNGGYDFFNMGSDQERKRWTTEDYAFCQRWRDIGGQLWVYPDIDFTHVGRKGYKGNLHNHLIAQPGSSLERTLRIKGWLLPREAEWLAQQASKHQTIIEMGSGWGRSTRAMADHLPALGVIYAIDDWYGAREANITKEDRGKIYDEFCSNLSDLIASDRVKPIRHDHAKVADLQLPQPDMVFIDGDHQPEAVMRDVRFWKERIKPGGLICGHDFNWETVAVPVQNLLPETKQVPGTSLWYWEAK